jgi:hypothetical protein
MFERHSPIPTPQLAVLLVLTTIGSVSAAPQLDVINNVGGGSAARELRPSNFWAQSFTVGADGLLSRVDVQLGKFAGATGDVMFEIRPLVGGLPTIDDRSRLFATTININDVPVINSPADPPPFVSVDVSGAGLHARPGDVYAISMRRSGGVPAAAWRSKTNTYAGGTGYFRNLLSSPWGPSADDLGFQTWIDPAPTAPYKLRVDAAYDVKYEPGTVSTLTEGEAALLVGGLPEERPLMEFPLGGLPANAVIEGAHLEFDWYVSSGAPMIEVLGFAGDGIASFPDATTPGTILATTGPTSASSPNEIPIDEDYVASLVGQASHLGVRMRSLNAGGVYVGFTALEGHNSLVPPRLVIDYTLPQQLAGDYNDDGRVDAADYVTWRKTGGTPSEYETWRSSFGLGEGSGVVAHQAIPEPAVVLLVSQALLLMVVRRREKAVSQPGLSPCG